jgi:hypothetical protein
MPLNLMLHCGASAVERTALKKVKLPEVTKSFCPINHDYFVDLVQDRLEDRNLRVMSEAHGLTKDGANYFGMFEVRGQDAHEDYSTVIGMRNSHVKWFAASIAVGGGVFVCDNLAFTGEVVVGHKHTTNVLDHLPSRIEGAMDNVIKLDTFQGERYQSYKDRDFGDREAEFTMVELFRAGVLNTRSLPKVVNEWDIPSHEEFTNSNIWRFFNACTEAYKGLDPYSLQRTTSKLHEHLDILCDVPALELVEPEDEAA